jgi:hypothetical protein
LQVTKKVFLGKNVVYINVGIWRLKKMSGGMQDARTSGSLA